MNYEKFKKFIDRYKELIVALALWIFFIYTLISWILMSFNDYIIYLYTTLPPFAIFFNIVISIFLLIFIQGPYFIPITLAISSRDEDEVKKQIPLGSIILIFIALAPTYYEFLFDLISFSMEAILLVAIPTLRF